MIEYINHLRECLQIKDGINNLLQISSLLGLRSLLGAIKVLLSSIRNLLSQKISFSHYLYLFTLISFLFQSNILHLANFFIFFLQTVSHQRNLNTL